MSNENESIEIIPDLLNTEINSLSDENLRQIFQYLNFREKLSVERVCKRWQTNILYLCAKQKALGTTWTNDKYENCLDANEKHCVTMGDIRQAVHMADGTLYDMTSDYAIRNFRSISRKCPSLECLHICWSIINSNFFEQIVCLFPKLECLHLKNNLLDIMVVGNDANERDEYCQKISKQINDQWCAIGQRLGPLLRHLNINSPADHRMSGDNMINLLKHFSCLDEFRIGKNFCPKISWQFLSFLPKECKLFHSLGNENFSVDSLKIITNNDNHKTVITHLSLNFQTEFCLYSVYLTANSFENLIALRINLVADKRIEDPTIISPITKLKQLKELSVDIKYVASDRVDITLIWFLKDPIPTVDSLEISNLSQYSSLSVQTFTTIVENMPQLKRLTLNAVEFKCSCALNTHIPSTSSSSSSRNNNNSSDNSCTVCKEKCCRIICGLLRLEELIITNYYCDLREHHRYFPIEFCQHLPTLSRLRQMTIGKYDISLSIDSILESLNKLMIIERGRTQQKKKDVFKLTLDSGILPRLLNIKRKNVFIYFNNFNL